MLPGKMPLRPAAALIGPDDLVQEPGLPEHLVAHDPRLRCHAPVQVQVKHAGLVQQFPCRPHQAAQQPQVFLFPGIPVAVRRIPRRRTSRPPSLFPVRPAAHKLFSRHERRIQVNALGPPVQGPEFRRQRQHIAALQQVLSLPEYFLLHADRFKHGAPPVQFLFLIYPVSVFSLYYSFTAVSIVPGAFRG